MADAITPDAPAPVPATVPTPADAPPADPSKTLLTSGEPDKAPDPAPEVKAPDAPKPVIPEKYEFAVPDGMQMDAAVVDALTPAFKELGLTQEAVNKLVEPYNKAMVAAEAKRETEFKDWMKTTTEQNVAAIRKEWGHEFDGNLKTAQKGLARVFGPEGKKLLDETGLGSHPEFLKAFFTVGKMISEDQPPPHTPAPAKRTPAEILYGTPTN